MRGTDHIFVDFHGLNVAILSVVNEGHSVDYSVAEELIKRVYAMRTDGQTGKEFRALFDKAIEGLKIPDDKKRGYELTLGRYFNARAVAAARKHPEKKKGPWIPQVLEADVEHVLLLVNPELKMDFKPLEKCREKPKLDWDDIRHQRQPPTDNSDVPDSLFRIAKRQALAILNKRRVPVPLKV